MTKSLGITVCEVGEVTVTVAANHEDLYRVFASQTAGEGPRGKRGILLYAQELPKVMRGIIEHLRKNGKTEAEIREEFGI